MATKKAVKTVSKSKAPKLSDFQKEVQSQLKGAKVETTASIPGIVFIIGTTKKGEKVKVKVGLNRLLGKEKVK